MMKRLLLLAMSCMSGPEFLYPDDPRLHSDKYDVRHEEVSRSSSSGVFRWYERPRGYPRHHIARILSNNSVSVSKFFNARKEEDEIVSSFLNTRILADDYENICDEDTHFIYPKQGTNKKGSNQINFRGHVNLALANIILMFVDARSEHVHHQWGRHWVPPAGEPHILTNERPVFTDHWPITGEDHSVPGGGGAVQQGRHRLQLLHQVCPGQPSQSVSFMFHEKLALTHSLSKLVYISLFISLHQEYSDIKLVALSENEEELIVETFQFPSCCICKVRTSTSLFLRSAKIPTE